METLSREAEERKDAEDRKARFERWLDDPTVRLAISMIPAGERVEALQMLLRSAFDAGYNSGGGALAGSLLHALISLNKKKPTQ